VSTRPDRSHSGLTRINVLYCTASGGDAVVDTFAVALNDGFDGVATPETLTALLHRAGPLRVRDATHDGLELAT
jgi:hypothetical protein